MVHRLCLYGGPGVGKSVMASEVFAALKKQGAKVELVQEYIKPWAWAKREAESWDWLHVFSQQLRREWKLLKEGVNVITDSPLPMQEVYIPGEWTSVMYRMTLAFEMEYPGLHVILDRAFPYEEGGRYQTSKEAWDLDDKIGFTAREIAPANRVLEGVKPSEVGKVIEFWNARSNGVSLLRRT